MKSITIFLTILVLSLNVLAFANSEKSNSNTYGQNSARMQEVLNQENLPDALSADSGVKGRALTQDTNEKQDELFIQLSVYLFIILVYRYYWLKANDIKKAP